MGEKIQEGEAGVPTTTFTHQWSEDGQQRATTTIAKLVAKDRLAPNIVAGAGSKLMMHELLVGRQRVPVPSTIASHINDFQKEHDTKLAALCGAFAKSEH